MRLPLLRPVPLPETMYLVQQPHGIKGTTDLRVLRIRSLGLSVQQVSRQQQGPATQAAHAQEDYDKDGTTTGAVSQCCSAPCCTSATGDPTEPARPTKRARGTSTHEAVADPAHSHSPEDSKGRWGVWVAAPARMTPSPSSAVAATAATEAAEASSTHLANYSAECGGISLGMDCRGCVRMSFPSLEDAAFAVFNMLRLSGGQVHLRQALQHADSAAKLLHGHMQHVLALRTQLEVCLPAWQFAGGLVPAEDVQAR